MNGTTESIPSPQLTVILVVKDEPAIQSSLEVLKPQCEEFGAECIVVDASANRLLPIAEAHSWVQWISYEQPRDRKFTISHQRNIGVAAASSPFVAFCDAGGVPASDWVETVTHHLVQNSNHVYCGPIDSIDSKANLRLIDVRIETELEFAITCNMAFSVETFWRVGGFDENLDHGEDIDFGWRCRDKGITVVGVPDLIMGISWGDFERQKRRAVLYGRSTGPLLYRNSRHVSEFLKAYPDALLYPLIVLTLPFAVISGRFRAMYRISLGATVLTLMLRNRHAPSLGRFFQLKIIRALWTLASVATLVLPRNHNRQLSGAPATSKGERSPTAAASQHKSQLD